MQNLKCLKRIFHKAYTYVFSVTYSLDVMKYLKIKLMNNRSFPFIYQPTNTLCLAIEINFFFMLLPKIIPEMSENKKPNSIPTQVSSKY